MKHTFWYIDKLMDNLAQIKDNLESDDDVKKAIKDLEEISKYNYKLNKLITAHKTVEHLNKLLMCHIDTIPDWAKRVTEQFQKLDSLMRMLNKNIPELQRILKKGRTKQNDGNYNEWSTKIGDLGMELVMSGFIHIEEDMEKFCKAEIFERKHLYDIIGDLEEIEEMLK